MIEAITIGLGILSAVLGFIIKTVNDNRKFEAERANEAERKLKDLTERHHHALNTGDGGVVFNSEG